MYPTTLIEIGVQTQLDSVNSPQQEILSRENDAPRAPFDELVQIPAIYKGRVIGKGGDNLRNISTQTGAKKMGKCI